MHLLIYIEKESSRATYAFKIIFKIILGIPYRITSNKEEFITSDQPKINYSQQAIANELFIRAHSLLYATGTDHQIIHVFEHDSCKVFFKTNSDSALPFDIFAAAFYLVSRYEEYQPTKSDRCNRFSANQSIAYKNNFLDEPVVNIWAEMLGNILKNKFPDIVLPERKFRYISTIDVDNAWAFLNKSFFRGFASTLRSLIKLDFSYITARFNVVSGRKKDPYDTYDYLEQIHNKYGTEPIYFFLLGSYNRYDKNIAPENIQYKNLIRNISKKYSVGIHPSYASNKNPDILKKEVDILQSVIDADVIKSRQHFLQLKLPETYRNLISLGIKEDYTMGYASQPGFRAGICTPFPFYDLQKEEETELMIFPFQVMETTYKEYLNMQPNETINEIIDSIKKVKKVNGTFISLWHNESVGNQLNWKGWRMVYEKMLDFVFNL